MVAPIQLYGHRTEDCRECMYTHMCVLSLDPVVTGGGTGVGSTSCSVHCVLILYPKGRSPSPQWQKTELFLSFMNLERIASAFGLQGCGFLMSDVWIKEFICKTDLPYLLVKLK